MNTARIDLALRVVPRRTAAGRGEQVANWLALIALLALSIAWQ